MINNIDISGKQPIVGSDLNTYGQKLNAIDLEISNKTNEIIESLNVITELTGGFKVIEFPTFEDFPTVGKSGIYYFALNTQVSYLWSGSVYIPQNIVDEALKLHTPRSISMSGDIVGTPTFYDGSSNIVIPSVLSTTGVSANTYKSVTVDTKGRITSGTNPTTLDGFGITDGLVAKIRTNWNDGSIINKVIGLLAWKNFGNNHIIFDASKGTDPSEGIISNTDSVQTWIPTYPILMGWNGYVTYGIRVDVCRLSDKSTLLSDSRTIGTMTGDITSTGSSFNGSGNNTNSTTISNNAVTNTKLAKMPTLTVKGNNTGGTADSLDLTVGQIQTMVQDTTHRMVTDTQINTWNSVSPPILVTVNSMTGTYTIPDSLSVGTIYEIRMLDAICGTVLIDINGTSEKFTKSLLNTISVTSDGDYWTLKKISSTRWDILEGRESCSGINGWFTREANGKQYCEKFDTTPLAMTANGYGSYPWTFSKPFKYDINLISATGSPSITGDYFGHVFNSSPMLGSISVVFKNGATAQSISFIRLKAEGEWY